MKTNDESKRNAIIEEITNNIIVDRECVSEVIRKTDTNGSLLCLVNGPNRIGKDNLIASVTKQLTDKEAARIKFKKRDKAVEKFIDENIFTEDDVTVLFSENDDGILKDYLGLSKDEKTRTFLACLAEKMKQQVFSKKRYLFINNPEISFEKDEMKMDLFLRDINSVLENGNTIIVILSRYSLEKVFKDKVPDAKICSVSLGGLTTEEKNTFFAVLEGEEWYLKIDDKEKSKIRELFDTYAGSHPQLLNAIRRQLQSLPDAERTAEILEAYIKEELPKDAESGIFRIYSRMDELLEKEEMVNTEKGKKLSYRDLYISCFSADGRDTGFSEKVLDKYKEELYSKGYALKNDSGEYVPITPYMPVYLDKWRVEALDKLMAGLDELEDGIRYAISEKLLNLMKLETNGDEDAAWERAEEEVIEARKPDENSYLNYRVENRLNGIDKLGERNSDVIAPLFVMSFERYFAVMNAFFEYPHFSNSGLTKGQYKSLFEGFRTEKVAPILWKDEIIELKKLLKNIGTDRNKLETKVDKLNTQYDNWKNSIEDKAILKKLENAKNASNKTEILKDVFDETEDISVRKEVEKLLKRMDTLRNTDINDEIDIIISQNIILHHKDKEENDIFEKRYLSNDNNTYIDKLQFYFNEVKDICNAGNNLNYSDLEKSIGNLIEVMEDVCNCSMEKMNDRRISFNRARNIAKHRNNLDVLDVRRYTGLLDDCNAMLEELNNKSALQYLKISKYYSCFEVKQSDGEQKAEGSFIAIGVYEKLDNIPGVFEHTGSIMNCSLPVSWLDKRWENGKFAVTIKPSKQAFFNNVLLPLLNIEKGPKFSYNGNSNFKLNHASMTYDVKTADDLRLTNAHDYRITGVQIQEKDVWPYYSITITEVIDIAEEEKAKIREKLAEEKSKIRKMLTEEKREYLLFRKKANSDKEGAIYNWLLGKNTYPAVADKCFGKDDEKDLYYRVTEIKEEYDGESFVVTLGDPVERISQNQTYEVKVTSSERTGNVYLSKGYFVINGEPVQWESKEPVPVDEIRTLKAVSWNKTELYWKVEELPQEKEAKAAKDSPKAAEKEEKAKLVPKEGLFYVLKLDRNNKGFLEKGGETSGLLALEKFGDIALKDLNGKLVRVISVDAAQTYTVKKADEVIGRFIDTVREKGGKNANTSEKSLGEWVDSLSDADKQLLLDCNIEDISLSDLKKELKKLQAAQMEALKEKKINALYTQIAGNKDEEEAIKAWIAALDDADYEVMKNCSKKKAALDYLKSWMSVYKTFYEGVDKKSNFLTWLNTELDIDKLGLLTECKLQTPSLDVLKAWIKWTSNPKNINFLSIAKDCEEKFAKDKDLYNRLNELIVLAEAAATQEAE
ncbi:MAG: hypothetical protein IJ353_07270 [Lachnospiraceae bacterium]|nr:hypothetical protein [Lachnospiraceae bacterium]